MERSLGGIKINLRRRGEQCQMSAESLAYFSDGDNKNKQLKRALEMDRNRPSSGGIEVWSGS